MLWAALLTEVFPRRDYLACFRAIVNTCVPWFGEYTGEAGKSGVPVDSEGINYTLVLDHTKLSQLTDDQFATFVGVLIRHPLGYAALRPLLLLEALPDRERWRRALDVEPTFDDWQTLGLAVAATLDHQSEKSTDVRWLKLMLPIIAGRMQFHESMSERVQELLEFPDKGDMRSVRPSIRAGEISLRRTPPSAWIADFWAELLEKTSCIDPSTARDYVIDRKSEIDTKSLYRARRAVIARFLVNMSPKRTDPRLDSAFGLVLYAFSLNEEVAAHSIAHRVLGRLALRALVESNITLRYLAHRNSDELWQSYRVYGAGQAKLAFLKAQEAEELPSFIDEEGLHAIANEDIWQEFLEIDVGHWAKTNLRALALDCGAKDTYDKYYGWPSAFVHAHWGAVRDTNFITCHNPLHRLHRIPRQLHRKLSSVETDAIDLANQMISALDALYPGDEALPHLILVA